MSLNLIKLCVGCDSVAELSGWIKQRIKQKKARKEKPEHIHTTRMVPKRIDELLDGGSLYWVIRGQVTCRRTSSRSGHSSTRTGLADAGWCSAPK